MGQENDKKLTVNDPVSPEELNQLAEIQARRFEIADTLLDMEQERVKLLVQARQVDDARNKLFTKIVTDRGLPPGFPVEVDAKTGAVKAIMPQGPNGAPDQPQAGQQPLIVPAS